MVIRLYNSEGKKTKAAEQNEAGRISLLTGASNGISSVQINRRGTEITKTIVMEVTVVALAITVMMVAGDTEVGIVEAVAVVDHEEEAVGVSEVVEAAMDVVATDGAGSS